MPKRELQPHHAAWLKAHPHRTEGWLVARLREGFDVHHIDGDHTNNCPLNLVMIEHTDHLALHNGGFYALGRLKPWGTGKRKKSKAKARRKQRALDNYAADQAKVVDLAKRLKAS